MTLIAIVAGLLAVAQPAADAQSVRSNSLDDRFRACHERLAARPDDYDSAYCFYAAAFDAREWDAGVRVLDSLMRATPDNFWLPLVLGHLHRNRQPARLDAAEVHYRKAADGFRAAG